MTTCAAARSNDSSGTVSTIRRWSVIIHPLLSIEILEPAKVLKDILYKVPLLSVQGNTDIAIHTLQFDSRKITQGDVFLAIKGVQSDGHQFIEVAIEKGAIAVICEEIPPHLHPQVTYVQTRNSSEALGIMAANYYDNPSAKLKLTGITGTNGKTTTVTLLHRLFRKLGYNAGLLSTIQNKINDDAVPSTHTTPDALSLNALLAEMVRKGCTHAFMEVSSHALVQHRTTGLQFKVAIFSNITHDHLDYHKTFDEYIRAKKLFFDGLSSDAFALVNKDDKRGLVMVQNTKAKIHTFALKSLADFKARVVSNTLQGLEMEIENKNVWFQLIGEFNAYNLLGIYGAAVLLGEEPDEVLTALSSIASAPGRFEQVISASHVTAIVDYAHTPDALRNVLETIQELRTRNEQVITIVGCGGNRDATKRPIMADIACKFSDRVILTSDNPRFEEPEAILEDMKKGVSPADFKKTLVIVDRREAIEKACEIAQSNDIILIAGKGHEDYQEVKGVKHHFDDREIVSEIFRKLEK